MRVKPEIEVVVSQRLNNGSVLPDHDEGIHAMKSCRISGET